MSACASTLLGSHPGRLLSLSSLRAWSARAVSDARGCRNAAARADAVARQVAWASHEAASRVAFLQGLIHAAGVDARVQPLLLELQAATLALRAAPPASSALAAHAAGLERVAVQLVSAGLQSIGTHGPPDAVRVPVLSTLAWMHVLLGQAASVALDDASSEEGPIASTVDVRLLADGAVSRVRALLVDKCGVAPPIDVSVVHDHDSDAPGGSLTSIPGGSEPMTPPLDEIPWTCVPSYVSYALIELLKNASHAHVLRYTPLHVEDAPPVALSLRVAPDVVCVTVRDAGRGFPSDGSYPQRGSAFAFGAGAASRRSDGEGDEPTYAYSRSFGAPLSGAGAGLPRSAIYASLHGGTLGLEPTAGGDGGIEARLVLLRTPDAPIDPSASLHVRRREVLEALT